MQSCNILMQDLCESRLACRASSEFQDMLAYTS